MHPQCQNNHNNTQMEIAMQRMAEVHTEMMRVLTQNMVNRDSNKIPPGMQLKGICPRGNNKVVIILFRVHNRCLFFMLELY
jgi:hypothetical protein